MHTSIALINLGLAALLANLPFLRLLGVRSWGPALNDLAGWATGYVLWMTVARMLESAASKPSGHNWEVWAVTLALFAVLAFPGIVCRHLLRK
jgi:hypothetical protein